MAMRDLKDLFARPLHPLLLLGLMLLCLVGCQDNPPPTTKSPVAPAATTSSPQTLLMPEKGAYAGGYVDFGEGEAQVTYDALVDFERLSGKHLAVVAFGNFWGDQAFPAKTVRILPSFYSTRATKSTASNAAPRRSTPSASTISIAIRTKRACASSCTTVT